MLNAFSFFALWIWLVETRDILLTLVLYVNCFVVRFFMGKISWLLCISSGLALLLCSLVLLAIFLLQEIYWQRQFFFSDNGPVMCFSTPHRSWEKLQFSIALLSSLEWGCTRPITATQLRCGPNVRYMQVLLFAIVFNSFTAISTLVCCTVPCLFQAAVNYSSNQPVFSSWI